MRCVAGRHDRHLLPLRTHCVYTQKRTWRFWGVTPSLFLLWVSPSPLSPTSPTSCSVAICTIGMRWSPYLSQKKHIPSLEMHCCLKPTPEVSGQQHRRFDLFADCKGKEHWAKDYLHSTASHALTPVLHMCSEFLNLCCRFLSPNSGFCPWLQGGPTIQDLDWNSPLCGSLPCRDSWGIMALFTAAPCVSSPSSANIWIRWHTIAGHFSTHRHFASSWKLIQWTALQSCLTWVSVAV